MKLVGEANDSLFLCSSPSYELQSLSGTHTTNPYDYLDINVVSNRHVLKGIVMVSPEGLHIVAALLWKHVTDFDKKGYCLDSVGSPSYMYKGC